MSRRSVRRVRLVRLGPLVVIPGALALVVLAACGGGGGGGVTKAAVGGRIEVAARDISFDVQTITAAPGPLTVVLREKGSLAHTFRVKGHDFELKVDRDTTEETGTVTLAKGTYDFDCTVDNHAQQGMKGKIVVG